MPKVVNLNKVRKQKARAAAETLAAENRIRYGRTKVQKMLDAAVVEDAQRRMDRLKRDSDKDE